MAWKNPASLNRSLSLRAQLSLCVVAIVLITTFGLATVALHFVKRQMQASIAQEQFARISALADAVDQKFISRRILLRNFSESVRQQRFNDSAALQSFLMAHEKSLRESFDNVAFLDLTGELVANLNGAGGIGKLNIADREYFRDTLAQKEGVISKPYRNRLSGLAQVAVTQPVLDEAGAVRWVISGVINLAEQNFLGELASIKFGKTGYMFIINTEGIVVDHPQKERLLKHIDALGGTNKASSLAVAGFEGTTEAMNRVGVYGLYAFKRTRQTNWVLGAIYPRAEAFQQIDRIEWLAWGGALLLTLSAGGLTLAVLAWQLSPLTRLHEHMQQVRAADAYAPHRDASAQREVQDLARTFNALMLEREQSREELQARETRLRAILTHAGDAFVSIDESGRITEWNRQAEQTFGWTKSEVLGQPMSQLLIPEAMRAAHQAGFAQFTRTGSGPVVDRRIEVSALHKEGHEIPVELSVAAIRSGDSFVANAFMRDITERRRAQEELAALSRIDTLTQLPNRRSFLERLEEALARSRRSGRALALMYLDVDHFKQINDTHGHAVGDEVLVAFARRLQACVRSTDTVARLAGDEFVIILEGLNESSESSLVGDKIVAAMQEPMVLKQHRLRVTSSIGIAVIEAIAPGHESAFARLGRLTGDELISRADQALYEAKRAGRNRFALLDVA